MVGAVSLLVPKGPSCFVRRKDFGYCFALVLAFQFVLVDKVVVLLAGSASCAAVPVVVQR